MDVMSDSRQRTSNRRGANPSEHRLVALNFRVPVGLRRQLRITAAQRGVTMTSLMLELIEKHCQSEARAAVKKDGLK
jgi:hypothetical protein